MNGCNGEEQEADGGMNGIGLEFGIRFFESLIALDVGEIQDCVVCLFLCLMLTIFRYIKWYILTFIIFLFYIKLII
jgi:hypothetical protein